MAEREGLLVAGVANGFQAEAHELGGDVVHREAMATGAGVAAFEEIIGEEGDVGADAALGEGGGFVGVGGSGKEREGGDGGEGERAEVKVGNHWERRGRERNGR